MSKQQEALRLALETLEWINRVNAMEYEYQQKARDSLNAIREALAKESSGTEQPKLSDYEPDGMHHNKPHKCKYPKCDYPCPDLPDCRDAEQTVEEYDPDNRTISVYPSEWKAHQEPVAKVVTDNSRELVVESLTSKYLRKGTKLYTFPPASKPWVGLTNEDKAEIEKIVGITEDDDGWMVSQMFTLTEAKLKEKNA